MEWFIETRFGDPVLVIDMVGSHMVYGTALGQIGYLDILKKEHVLLTEMTEESIRGIHISPEFIIYAAVGDLYVLCLFRSQSGEWHMEGISHEGREHTSLLCGFTQVIQHRTKVCLIIIEEDKDTLATISAEGKGKLLITNASASETEEWNGLVLPEYSVPLDFNGEKFLWMERDLSSNRILKLIIFNPFRHHNIKNLQTDFGHISHLYLVQDKVVFVHNFREIKSLDVFNGDSLGVIGKHTEDIVALYPTVKATENESPLEENDGLVVRGFIVSVDKSGTVILWENGKKMEEIDLGSLEGLNIDESERFFSLGYPYVIKASGEHISISTDLGILIVRSMYLKHIGGLDTPRQEMANLYKMDDKFNFS